MYRAQRNRRFRRHRYLPVSTPLPSPESVARKSAKISRQRVVTGVKEIIRKLALVGVPRSQTN
jgi:hypothetical protein